MESYETTTAADQTNPVPQDKFIVYTSSLKDHLAMGTLKTYTTVTYNIMVNGPK